jgi:hypothetical protein
VRALVCALAALVAASAAAAGGGLVWHTSHNGFRVKVPAGWRYKNASYPSDHSTELWTSPGDRASRLEVEVIACVGCVEPRSCTLSNTGCRPAPEAALPAHVLSKQRLDRWRIAYVERDPASRYPVHGEVAIVHEGSHIRGFALARAWLPQAQAATARAVIASFTLL